MKKNKTDKVLNIVGITIAAFIVTYFGGGMIATTVINENLINVRGTDENSLEKDPYFKTQYIRKDYPLMNDREEISFPHGKETLRGYFYEVENPHGVVIAAHGVYSLSDGTNAQFQNYFIEKGWSVFAFDMVGCGLSSGKGMVSLCESRFCVGSAIKFVKNYSKTQGLPLFLIGHSWGGYGVTAASGDYEVNGVCSLAGFNVPDDMMYGFAEYYAGGGAAVTKPALDMSTYFLFGEKAYYKASSAIKKRKNTKYVVIQGDRDTVVPLERYSIYSNIIDKKYDNVTAIKLEDVGHVGLWRTMDAIKYSDDVLDKQLDEFKKQYGDEIPDSVLNPWVETIDKEKSSAMNYSLLDQVNDIFLSTL